MITATNQFHLCHSAFARVATAGHQRTCGHGLFKVVNNGTRNEGISALAGMEHFASAHSRGLRLGLAVKLPCRYWLCLSAFARVATLRPFSAAHGGTIFATAHSRGLRHVRPIRRRSSDPFATAHSRGLRPASHLKAGITRFFATAHSRGLRRFDNPQKEVDIVLCHSAFARVATQPLRKVNQPAVPLPQRIRAGCDNHDKKAAGNGYSLPQRIRAGCDRQQVLRDVRTLSLPQRIRAGCDAQPPYRTHVWGSLPQRIRAGCDRSLVTWLSCGWFFATAHSRGLRRQNSKTSPPLTALCHSAFARVATPSSCHTSLPRSLCHSAFVRVATREIRLLGANDDFATAHSCGLRRSRMGKRPGRADFATAHSCGLRLAWC